MITFPIAKINLGLNVVERRPDGYHNLETVFYPVSVKDRLEVSLNHKVTADVDCDLQVTNVKMDCDNQQNLVVKAYQLLKRDFPQMRPVVVSLEKNIPTQAGMGGGSSDCAFMLQMLNEMFQLGLNEAQLVGYASRLGADCAFFIKQRPCYAEGIGERLQAIDLNLKGKYLAVVRPDIPVSTKEAFSLITPNRPQQNCRDIVMQPVETWRDKLTNDFEKSVFALHPTIGKVKNRLYEMGAVYAAMSGSGSALFGIFRNREDCSAEQLERQFGGMFTTSILL